MTMEGRIDGASSAGARFRAWVLGRTVEGYRSYALDETHLRLEGEAAIGELNFYRMDDGAEIAEMRISRAAGGEQTFFLHFMMDDLARARELFSEMAEVLLEIDAHETVQVLLCCSCGITTHMFAAKMNEVASTLSLGYEFEARSLDAAVAAGRGYAAVMLAPQVASQRARVAAAFPDAAVFEIPAKIYGSYDAAGAVRLAEHVLERKSTKLAEVQGRDAPPIPVGDALVWGGRVMVVTAVLGARLSSYEYRVYDGGEEVLRGHVDKRGFDFRDIEDLLAGVRLRGIDADGLDAIGIAVPGIVDEDRVSLLSSGVRDYDLGGHLREAFGTRVFLDNDANAAAVGCFAIQRDYRSITFHREDFGHAGCGQGSIVDGRLVTGRRNFAGELNHLLGALSFSADPHDLAWTEDGLREVVSRFLLCNICAYAPEAIYVDAWPITDMDALRAELTPFLDEEYLPELIPAPSFGECAILGELALCVQRLRKPA